MNIKIKYYEFKLLIFILFLVSAVVASILFMRNEFSSERKKLDLSSESPKRYHVAFFEQAQRRDPRLTEIKPILKLHNTEKNTICTGFFIENESQRFIVGTHNHCASFNFEQICTDSNKSDAIVFTPSVYKTKGFCKRVIAQSNYNDFIILEVEFPEVDKVQLLKSIQFLKLGFFLPKQSSPLKMIGHPSDQERKTRLTVTENCSVLSTEITAFSFLTEQEKSRLSNGIKNRNRSNEEAIKRSNNLAKAEFLGHNCTTYGGNSGGPILVAKTKIVVGLPAGFFPGIYRPLPSNSSLRMETTHGFIKETLNILKSEGIILIRDFYFDKITNNPIEII